MRRNEEKNPRRGAGRDLVVNGTFTLRRVVRAPGIAMPRPTAAVLTAGWVRRARDAASRLEPAVPGGGTT